MHCTPRLRSLRAVLALGFILCAGCSSDDGAAANYTGTWRGRTSNGGTATFQVDGSVITALRITDPPGDIWFPQPVDIRGSTFSAERADGSLAVHCRFSSSDEASGRYSMRKGGNTLTGTFTAARQ
jgi:hypothetical protein